VTTACRSSPFAAGGIILRRLASSQPEAVSIWNNPSRVVYGASMLELVVIKRRRGWHWQVHDQEGTVIAGGREKTRPAARYYAYRALFLSIAVGWKVSV
jgi:hypothetical protein